MKRKGYGRIILRIFIIKILKNRFAVHMCGIDGIQRSNYYGGEQIRRTEVEARVGKLKHGKAAVKNKVTREKVKLSGDMVVDWI